MTDHLYAINDALTALANQFCSIPPDDDVLNELTHHVAHEFGLIGFSDDNVGIPPVHVPGDPAGIVLRDADDDTTVTPDAIDRAEQARWEAKHDESIADGIDAAGGVEFSLDAVVTALTRAGIPAILEMTGGGCATIYAGKPEQVCDVEGEPHWNKYPVIAGPGWFNGRGYTIGMANSNEFYIGLNDDGETPGVDLSDVLKLDEDPIQLTVRIITGLVGK